MQPDVSSAARLAALSLLAVSLMAVSLKGVPSAARPVPLELGGVAVPAYGIVAFNRAGAGRTIVAGAAEIAPDGSEVRPFTAGTPVRIASISKVVVALALHRLADSGQLKLDDDVSKHLGWQLRNPAHPDVPITIRQMMRHESSISDAGGYAFGIGDRLRDKAGPESFSPAAPGSSFDYANLNQALLGEAIEQVTGKRFDEAARLLVLEPLQLEACFNWSGCRPETVKAGAVLYRKAPSDAGPWDAAGPWHPQVDAVRPPEACAVRAPASGLCQLARYVPGTNGSLFSPQGGLRISLSDLAELGHRLLSDDGFLLPETRASLFRAVRVQPAGKGGETDSGLMQYWSEGGLHCFSGTGAAGQDQPLSPQPLQGCGHLGEAYGLLSGLVIDPAAGTVVAYALTGVSAPAPDGKVSRFSAPEEALIGKVGDWLAARSDTMSRR
ncbi:MAG: serine hydrolase domain-containing protein [Sandaracinobacteroides sp.]